MAEECLLKGKDLSGLLLLYTSRSSVKSVKNLAAIAEGSGKNNIAFMCYYLLNDLDACINLLIRTDRIPEAAFFARTYAPSKVSSVVEAWKEDLRKINPKAAESLADPKSYPNLFNNLDLALKAETYLTEENLRRPKLAKDFPEHEGSVMTNLIEKMKNFNIEQNGNSSFNHIKSNF